jgi:dTDP-4-dehydrorhamnose 3,5-epimerase
MKLIETHFKDCYIIEPTLFEDERGYFYEKFNEKNLKTLQV